MGLGKDGYYSTADILKYKAEYNIILGERSPGKSYRVKADALREAWKRQQMTFIILRRYDQDIKTDYMQSYFADNMRHDGAYGDVFKITDGEYDSIAVYQGKIYFANKTENGKYVYGLQCGRTMALNLDERYKGQQYPTVKTVIYEEFVTRSTYLTDEPNRLMNLISTICREQEIKVFMIANTISRICPYFYDWALINIPKMEAGTIDTYKLDDTLIAVEFCKSRGKKNKMFFGEVAKSIQGGAWETKTVPHLPGEYDKYDVVYQMYVKEQGFTFKLELLINDDAEKLVYVYPYTKQLLRPDIPVLSAEFSSDPEVRPYLRKKIRAEIDIQNLWAENKVCYASNLCGADFKACISNMKGGLMCR